MQRARLIFPPVMNPRSGGVRRISSRTCRTLVTVWTHTELRWSLKKSAYSDKRILCSCAVLIQEFPQWELSVNASLRIRLSRSAALCVPNASRPRSTDNNHITLGADLQTVAFSADGDDTRHSSTRVYSFANTLWVWWEDGVRTGHAWVRPFPELHESVASMLWCKSTIIQFPLGCSTELMGIFPVFLMKRRVRDLHTDDARTAERIKTLLWINKTWNIFCWARWW